MNKALVWILFLKCIVAGVFVGIAVYLHAWAPAAFIAMFSIGHFINCAAKIIESAIERSNREQTKTTGANLD